ncbi:MAG: NUDIX hydrolase [Thermoproteus sp. AZ2]|jgi:ADP-ribose pyrophosphatase|uniref:NUDIX hydrolase n=1 Tax=Thermoproteus sp. AZ2 TaxID=1609232 RepID=A0ACC6UZ11_9CREN|nr:MAG: hydrolase [Thermoproteus sp. AZ2]
MEELLYRARKFDLVRITYTLAGRRVVAEVLRHPGAVAAVLKRNGLIFVKQYRPAVGAYTLEIPAGTLKRGEAPEDGLKRELVEETGYLPTKYVPMGWIYPSPGVSDEKIYLYFVEAAEYVGVGQRDPGEADMEVVEVGVEEAFGAVAKGEIRDGKTVAALFLARQLGYI